MADQSTRTKPLRPAELEKRLRVLLNEPLSDQDLRAELEALATQPSFPGFTWLWGPELYRRNRVLFRPFILSHFGSILFDPPRKWKPVRWEKGIGTALEEWLEVVDRNDDIELFRLLYQWKTTPPGKWRPDHQQIRADLAHRFKNAGTEAERRLVLAKFDLWYQLDEPTAMTLYRLDSKAAAPFILRHLPVPGWNVKRRKLWQQMMELAKDEGDEEFCFLLYRRQVPLKVWREGALEQARRIENPQDLVAALEKRHPEGYGLDLGDGFYDLLTVRGRDVLPYVMKHLVQVRSGRWFRTGFDKLLEMARDRGWFDLWGALMRVAAQPKEYNREVGLLLDDPGLSDQEKQRRLLLLAGVSREFNWPGLGIARVQFLDEPVALRLYQCYPELIRGPFKLHVAPTWGRAYPQLVRQAIDAGDETLVDYLASRLLTRHGPWAEKVQIATAETLAAHYESLRQDSPAFARRVCAVLGQVPAYTIFNYGGLIRDNRLARLLFERSSSFYLADLAGVRDLIEAPEIHVQALAYRVVSLDDDRARQAAVDNLDMLIGTLLRPLHRKTRLLAFGALLNAAHSLERARRIHQRAREALDLPDIRYPKEKLVGLIAQLLRRWPELRTDLEQPVVYREVAS